MKDEITEQEVEETMMGMGEGERRELEDNLPDFDLKTVPCWVAPKEDGPKILTMPNIPQPLHGLAPRTILGKATWDHMRKACYYEANYTCQACGKQLGRGESHAHELYTYNYVTGQAKFERCVCLCELCHVRGIHSGRALTMFKKGNPLMPKQRILEGAENLFKLLHEYNVAHPDEPPLRAYATFIDYAKWPPLQKEMLELIKKYDVKFYQEDIKHMAKWSKWALRMGTGLFPTPYADQGAWAEAMEAKDKENHNMALKSRTDAEIAIDEILGIDGTQAV